MTIGSVVIGEHVANVIHDLTHRKPVLQVDKLLQHREVKEAVKATAGDEVYRVLRPWLANVANAQRPPATSIERVLSAVRKNATIVNMGWKLTTGIVQPLGYLQTLEVLGERYSLIGLKRFYRNPVAIKDTVFEKSAMMRNRSKTYDRDVKDAINSVKRSDPLYWMEKTWFSHIGFMDLTVSLPSWVGAFEKATDEGRSEADAIAYADSIVRMSQSSGSAKDLSHIQQGSPLKRLFTMFYSYFNVLHNLLVRRGKILKEDGVKGVPRAMMSFASLVVLPAILSEMIAGRWNWEDDEEEQLKHGLILSAAYPFQTMVGMRDVVNGLVTDYGYSMTPVGDAIAQIGRGGKEVTEVLGDDDFESSDAKAMTMAAGYIFGLPTRQLWLTGEGLYNVLAEGDDINLVDLLLTDQDR